MDAEHVDVTALLAERGAGVLWSSTTQVQSNVVALPPHGGVDEHVEPTLDVLLVVVAGSGSLTTTGDDGAVVPRDVTAPAVSLLPGRDPAVAARRTRRHGPRHGAPGASAVHARSARPLVTPDRLAQAIAEAERSVRDLERSHAEIVAAAATPTPTTSTTPRAPRSRFEREQLAALLAQARGRVADLARRSSGWPGVRTAGARRAAADRRGPARGPAVRPHLHRLRVAALRSLRPELRAQHPLGEGVGGVEQHGGGPLRHLAHGHPGDRHPRRGRLR